jgi:hypothetical protein
MENSSSIMPFSDWNAINKHLLVHSCRLSLQIRSNYTSLRLVMLKNNMKEEYAQHVLTVDDDYLYGQDDAIFAELLRRAGVPIDKYLEANDEYKFNDNKPSEHLQHSDEFEEVELMYDEINEEMDPTFPEDIDADKLSDKFVRRMDTVDMNFERRRKKILKDKDLCQQEIGAKLKKISD